MLKIKLHTVQGMGDIEFLDLVYSKLDIIYHSSMLELLEIDSPITAVINMNYLQNNPEHFSKFIQKSNENKLVILDLCETQMKAVELFTMHMREHDSNPWFHLYKAYKNKRISIIGLGDSDPDINFINVEWPQKLTATHDNIAVALNIFDDIYNIKNKPYKFLFLNNRPRLHRLDLINKLQYQDLLTGALWTNISAGIKLPDHYLDIFSSENKSRKIGATTYDYGSWGDGALLPELYTDTYFSIITETYYDTPEIVFSEKIYKALLIGHPFIAVSSHKFYKALKNRGYKTFDHLINESFDDISDSSDRLSAIISSIGELCSQNLDEFLDNARPICKHNQLRFLEELGKLPEKNYNLLMNFFNKI